MATYTSNYGWTKPSGSDNVDISVLNDNLDDQDSTIHDAFLNMAPPFSESSIYAVDDIVLYGTGLYKCHTAVVTPGSWTGSTNWQVYKLSEGGSGGGGTSNYNQLTNKPQINSVELSGNKTSAQLGLMASDGVVANPTGQTTGTLTALEVGGTKYAVPSGGTSDYTALTNKPSINNVTLSGNKTTSDLGISYTDLTNKPSLATVATSGSYADLTSKPQVNGVELSGNKTASQLGMANSNTFQGTIAEWNALTTAEKKAYDHASIPDSIDGGVTFPANKVVMTGGRNVEDAVDRMALKSLAVTERFFTDFNTAVDGGLYIAPNYKAFNASPQSTSDDSCMLLVLKDEPYVVQICISIYRFNTIYIRRRLETTWSAWKSISLT